MSEGPLFDNDALTLFAAPANEHGSPLGASGGAAPLLQANSPHVPNAGLPWLNRRRERVWNGRIERHPGAE